MAEFIKNYGSLADRALTEPVTITKNGRDRLVVVSMEEYVSGDILKPAANDIRHPST